MPDVVSRDSFSVMRKFRDMGDGSHAEVLSAQTSVPALTSATILSLTTHATGATYTAFSSSACTALDLVNPSDVDVEYRRGATGTAMRVPSKSSRLILCITNASQIDVRRFDQLNSASVIVYAEAFVA